jgi:hypothetical protein
MLQSLRHISSMKMDNTIRFIQLNPCAMSVVAGYFNGGKGEDDIPIRPGCV